MERLSWRNCLKKFTYLWGMYSDILRIPPRSTYSTPLDRLQFFSPFHNIIEYSLEFINGLVLEYIIFKEHFMLSFIKISALYESYLFGEILCYFRDRGYSLSLLDVAYIRYQNDGNTKNTSVRNTFVLKNGQKRITLYYQPVIFDTDQRSVNGIWLYRNNSISVYAGNEDDCRQAVITMCQIF